MYSDDELSALGLTPATGHQPDAVVLHTDHAEYRALGEADVAPASVVYDGRNVLDPAAFPSVRLFQIGKAPR
jgi:UDP-N-acetyl-D-mannosaminuronate dehydrogenase